MEKSDACDANSVNFELAAAARISDGAKALPLCDRYANRRKA